MSESKKPEQMGTSEADKQKDEGATKNKKNTKAPKEEELVSIMLVNISWEIE